jgi:hypothetical protein
LQSTSSLYGQPPKEQINIKKNKSISKETIDPLSSAVNSIPLTTPKTAILSQIDVICG